MIVIEEYENELESDKLNTYENSSKEKVKRRMMLGSQTLHYYIMLFRMSGV